MAPAPVPDRQAITLARLTDPVVDAVGVDVTSAYAETYWLPVIGPSALWLLRHAARHTEAGPYETDVDTLARSLGLVPKSLRHTLDRLVNFGAAAYAGDGGFRLRARLAPLTARQIDRLPQQLQRTHAELTAGVTA